MLFVAILLQSVVLGGIIFLTAPYSGDTLTTAFKWTTIICAAIVLGIVSSEMGKRMRGKP